MYRSNDSVKIDIVFEIRWENKPDFFNRPALAMTMGKIDLIMLIQHHHLAKKVTDFLLYQEYRFLHTIYLPPLAIIHP